MANFRIRVGINRGRGPVDYSDISSLTQEINQFLRLLGQDAGLSDDENRWTATHIKDGSFLSTGIPGNVSAQESSRMGMMADAILQGNSVEARDLGVREQTTLQFKKLAIKASKSVPIEFGLYKSSRARIPKWRAISVECAESLVANTQPFVDYEGAIQGVIHAWYKESSEPHFDLRERAKNALVRCYYTASLYEEILKSLVVPDAQIHVAGLLRANRIDRSIESIKVRRIKKPVAFSDSDFEQFFGSAPNLTGELDSASFVASVRGDDA